MSLADVTAPAGPQAAHIAHLFDVFFWICVAVWLVLVASVVSAAFRKPTPHDDESVRNHASKKWLARAHRVIAFAITASAAILVLLLVESVLTGRALAAFTPDPAVTIDVIGHQWWWEFRVEDDVPNRTFVTANEIHIPVGQPVLFKLDGHDVIHSFWIPSLNGKRDVIPGKHTTLFVQADRAGAYDGICAEYCGLQHANMHFVVVADSPSDYRVWADAQRTDARAAQSDVEQRGLNVFSTARCPTCHAIRGTAAFATVGPDLTHVGSRMALGAGAIPNLKGHLAGWIADPQGIKPGTQMPSNILLPDDQDALLSYLGSLR